MNGEAVPLKYLILQDIILPASYIGSSRRRGEGAFLLNLSFSRQDLKTLKSMLSGLTDSMQRALYSGGD